LQMALATAAPPGAVVQLVPMSSHGTALIAPIPEYGKTSRRTNPSISNTGRLGLGATLMGALRGTADAWDRPRLGTSPTASRTGQNVFTGSISFERTGLSRDRPSRSRPLWGDRVIPFPDFQRSKRQRLDSFALGAAQARSDILVGAWLPTSPSSSPRRTAHS